jgi:hypothetical protein
MSDRLRKHLRQIQIETVQIAFAPRQNGERLPVRVETRESATNVARSQETGKVKRELRSSRAHGKLKDRLLGTQNVLIVNVFRVRRPRARIQQGSLRGFLPGFHSIVEQRNLKLERKAPAVCSLR